MDNITDIVIDIPTIFAEGIQSVLGLIGIAMILLSTVLFYLFKGEKDGKMKLRAIGLLILGFLLFIGSSIYAQNIETRKNALKKGLNEVNKSSEIHAKIPPDKPKLIPPKPIQRSKVFVHWNNKSSSHSTTKTWKIFPSSGFKLIPNSVKLTVLKKGKKSSVVIISKDIKTINIRAVTNNYGGILGKGQARGHIEIKVDYQEIKI